MLDFVIFAVVFLLALIAAVVYLYPGSKSKSTTVDGLDPSDVKEGNLPDIAEAGSLHEFLMELHKTYGPVASFWFGPKLCISLASPDLWKERLNILDRPPELFALFKPLISEHSLQYANGAEMRKRRNMTDGCFGHDSISLYFETFNKSAEEIAGMIETHAKGGEHVPLSHYMVTLAIKIISRIAMGSYFEDDNKIFELQKNYELCWHEMENTLKGDPILPDTPREGRFKKALNDLHQAIREVIELRRTNPPEPGEKLFIDYLMESDMPPATIFADVVTYMTGGFHTTGYLLTWAIYFMTTHEEVQDKLYQEFVDVLGEEPANQRVMPELRYARQVIDETMRCSVLAPWAARFQDVDTVIGEHVIPKGTPVIHALGVVLQDEKIWPSPNNFDPDRFTPEEISRRSKFAYQPFGLIGKRICPGYRIAYAEAICSLSVLCRKFKFELVEGQVVDKDHGLVTKPLEEIWVNVSKRK